MPSVMTEAPVSIRHLCVLWARFGPYHLARLHALHEAADARGMRITGLETSRSDATYAWAAEDGMTPFERVVSTADDDARPAHIRRAIRDALEAINPDAVAIPSYSTPDAQAALAWCRRRRRVAIMMFDSRASDTVRVPWRERIKRTLVRSFDAALVAGTPQARYAEALGIPPTHLFTPLDVVDNAHFARGAERDGALHPGPYILSVNRFTPRKNVEVVVRAYAEYRTRATDPWPLVLVGDGPERHHLEALAGPIEGITFAGFQQIDSLPAWYGGAGVYVHPAESDPWGLVVNEAMAASLPVLVSTGAGCAPDLVAEGENGFTFAPNDPQALARHLLAVTSDARMQARMGAQSRRRIERYTPEAFAQGMLMAAEAGRSRANRGLDAGASLVLRALAWAARRPDSFHTVEA